MYQYNGRFSAACLQVGSIQPVGFDMALGYARK